MSDTTKQARALAIVLGGSGVIHLVRPQTYAPLMPSWVPAHREVILGSGVVELVLAAGLLAPRSRQAAGWGSAALLLGVFPANLKMAGDAARSRSTGLKVAAYGRLPLQWPAVRTALRVARG